MPASVNQHAWPLIPPAGCAIEMSLGATGVPQHQMTVPHGREDEAIQWLRNLCDSWEAQKHYIDPRVRKIKAEQNAEAGRAVAAARRAAIAGGARPPPPLTGAVVNTVAIDPAIVTGIPVAVAVVPVAIDPERVCKTEGCGAPFKEHNPLKPYPGLTTGCEMFR